MAAPPVAVRGAGFSGASPPAAVDAPQPITTDSKSSLRGPKCERMAEQRMCSALSTYHMQTWLKLQAALQLCVGIVPEEERADALAVDAAARRDARLFGQHLKTALLSDASATHSSL